MPEIDEVALTPVYVKLPDDLWRQAKAFCALDGLKTGEFLAGLIRAEIERRRTA